MQDRVPTYPGRIKLTPVSGQENTYDMVRADEPTQEGTPLNKSSLLKDATAALYGLGVDAVPNDILSILSKAVLSVNGNLQDIGGSNVGTRIATGIYAGTGTYGASNPCSLTFDFVPKLVLICQIAYIPNGSSGYTDVGPFYRSYEMIWAFALKDSYKNQVNFPGAAGSSKTFYAKVVGNSIHWYGGSSMEQMNETNAKFAYAVIG